MDYADIQQKLKEGNLADTLPLLLKKTADLGDWNVMEETGNDSETAIMDVFEHNAKKEADAKPEFEAQ